MKVFRKFIVPFLLLVFVGCSSPYNYINMPYPVNQPEKVEKAEAMGKLYKLISEYQKNSKFIFSMSGLTPPSRNYNDKVKASDIGTKYKVKSVAVDKNIITLESVDQNCSDEDCIKTVLFKIDTNQPAKLCKVKRIHKETKEESYLYRLHFPFYVGYVNADGKEMVVDFFDGLNLESKEEMDVIVNLLSSVYTPKFICQ